MNLLSCGVPERVSLRRKGEKPEKDGGLKYRSKVVSF